MLRPQYPPKNLLRRAAPPEAPRSLEARVKKEWDAVKDGTNLQRLREFVAVFGPFFVDDAPRIDNGGDIAGGVELSAKVGLGPRGRERPGEKGETIRGLTTELQ